MAFKQTLGNLRRLFSGTESQIDTGSLEAKVIAVTAQKGGVGKTTTAVHLAAGLSLFHNRRVLLIDMDAQGHVGKSLSRDLPDAPHAESLGQILIQKNRDLYELARPTQIPELWLIPSDRELNDTETRISTRIGKELLLRQAIPIARTHFEVIVIDCPPNLGNLTINALVAADYALIPCDMSILSLDGVSSILETISTVKDMLNPSLQLLGLVRTRFDRRNQTMNRAIEDNLQAQYGELLLQSTIGTSTAIAKAQLAGCTVFHCAPKNASAQSYRALAAEIEHRLFG